MKLPRASTLMPVMFYAASGAAYALANLLVARRLPERDYAVFTLVLAIMTLAPSLAAAGLDGVAVRGGLHFVPKVATRVWLVSASVALAVAAAGATYDLGLTGVLLIAIAGATGGPTVVAAADLQRRHRYTLSLMLLHAPNYALLLTAAATAAADVGGAWLPLAGMSAGHVAAAGTSWRMALRQGERAGEASVPWAEAFALASTNASGSIMAQLDRLLIPYLLPLGALATYGVLSSVAGSLFRVVQRGVGYALLPRLRATTDVAERRRLVAGEAWLVGAVALVGSLVIWLAMPAVEHWLLADRYHFSGAVVLATLVAGCAKLLQAFSRAAVTALADPRELDRVNLAGWASLLLALVAAAVGARWGLPGVIYGVGLGWLVRTLASLVIMHRHLRPAERRAAW